MAIQENLKRSQGLKELLGLSCQTELLQHELQEVEFKNTFKAQVELNIDRYSGVVDVRRLDVFTRLSCANQLLAFKLNPLLEAQ